MKPSEFSTTEEILKKLKSVADVHTFDNAQTISHIFYDVLKISYYALVRKKEQTKPSKRKDRNILKRREITRLVHLINYHHVNDRIFKANHDLTQCLNIRFNENDALDFFENYVEGHTTDKFNRPIHIDLSDGMKFMYKDYETGLHKKDSQYFVRHRAERLPWIKHTIRNTSNIYTRIEKDDREIMYIAKYYLPDYEERVLQYWVVIVKKYKKDTIAPYKFKTAFPIFKYNRLLKRLERYTPIIDIENI